MKNDSPLEGAVTQIPSASGSNILNEASAEHQSNRFTDCENGDAKRSFSPAVCVCDCVWVCLFKKKREQERWWGGSSAKNSFPLLAMCT